MQNSYRQIFSINAIIGMVVFLLLLPLFAYTQDLKRTKGRKLYEISNHLGNVLTIVSDRKLAVDDGSVNAAGFTDYYKADVLTYQDYYAFGAIMPERDSIGYRFGFQGQEQDNEVKGKGNSINYTYRMHDARLGRFFAVDPLKYKYPFYSPFSFSGNRVIDAVEIEGLEENLLNEKQQSTLNSQIQNNDDENSIIESYWNLTKSGLKESMEVTISFLRRVDYQIFYGNHDGHTSRPPVETGFGGYRPVGEGANLNNHFAGNPDFDDDSGILPGQLIGSMSPTPVRNKKDIDDFDDLFDSDGVDFTKELGSGIDYLSDYIPELNNSDKKEVETKINQQNLSTHDPIIIIANTWYLVGDTFYKKNVDETNGNKFINYLKEKDAEVTTISAEEFLSALKKQ